MSDQSSSLWEPSGNPKLRNPGGLRDALETIARGGVPLGISPAQWAKDWLAAHPAEPDTTEGTEALQPFGLGVSDEPAKQCTCDPGPEGQHWYWCDLAHERRLPASRVGVSDEAVEAARVAYSEACKDTWHRDAASRFRAALEASQPFMQPQVVASRKAVAEALRDSDVIEAGYEYLVHAQAFRVADVLLAAGVFRGVDGTRPLPTLDREAALDAIAHAMLAGDGEYAGDWENPQNRAAYREVAGPYADAVMALVRPLPTREQIKQVLHDEGAFCGNCDYEDWESCDDCQTVLGAYADAVLNLLGGVS